MFCGECGTQNPDTNQFCKNCGKPLKRPQQVQAPPPAAAPVPAPAAAQQPAYYPPQPAQPAYYPPQPAGVQQYGIPPAGAAATATPPRNTGMLVLGILSVAAGIAAFFFFPYILGALALILGGVSVFMTRKKTGKIAYIAVIGIVIGLAAMLTNHFYFLLFPPKEFTLGLLTALF